MWPVAKRLRKLPKGRRINWILLIPDYAGVFNLPDEKLKEWAVLDLFDMLAPAYDSPQYLETVQQWFSERGMSDVEAHYGQNGIEGRGRKPLATIRTDRDVEVFPKGRTRMTHR